MIEIIKRRDSLLLSALIMRSKHEDLIIIWKSEWRHGGLWLLLSASVCCRSSWWQHSIEKMSSHLLKTGPDVVEKFKFCYFNGRFFPWQKLYIHYSAIYMCLQVRCHHSYGSLSVYDRIHLYISLSVKHGGGYSCITLCEPAVYNKKYSC